MELETLEDDVIKSQVARNALSNKYDEERDMEKELWARFVAEEDFCKEDSSAHLYSLEKYLNEEVCYDFIILTYYKFNVRYLFINFYLLFILG